MKDLDEWTASIGTFVMFQILVMTGEKSRMKKAFSRFKIWLLQHLAISYSQMSIKIIFKIPTGAMPITDLGMAITTSIY